MTAGIITQLNPVADYKVTSMGTGSEKGSDFSEVFKASTGKNGETEGNNLKASEEKTDSTVKSETKTKETEKTEEKKTEEPDSLKTKEEKAQTSTEDNEDISEEVEEAANALLADIATMLNVNVDDVKNALEELDLTATDLLDESVVPVLTAKIEGEDAVSIMTDENLFADVKEITSKVEETVSALAKENNVDEDDIRDFVKDLRSSLEENATETRTEVVATSKEQKNSGDGNEAQTGENLNPAQTGEDLNPAQTLVENIKAAAEGKSEEVSFATTTEMDRIYSQVQESIKVHFNEEVTEMEMNLHPASLGNVKVQVASRDGIITANFVTNNETVKAALESQIIQLKEDMNEQGIKVESIEITLASHAFEENLSENNEGTPAQDDNRKKRRSINLNEITDDADIIVEDDVRIAREMMMHNGTTVDYLA